MKADTYLPSVNISKLNLKCAYIYIYMYIYIYIYIYIYMTKEGLIKQIFNKMW